MKIVQYNTIYKQAYIDLNVAWIEEYFKMEEGDKEMLYHPETYLKSGAMIYFAIKDNDILATCMVMPLENNIWEICKLATDTHFKNQGAGSAVFKACIDYAIKHGAKKLTLITNLILTPAVHLYKKFGFQQVPIERPGEYQRTNAQFDYIVS